MHERHNGRRKGGFWEDMHIALLRGHAKNWRKNWEKNEVNSQLHFDSFTIKEGGQEKTRTTKKERTKSFHRVFYDRKNTFICPKWLAVLKCTLSGYSFVKRRTKYYSKLWNRTKVRKFFSLHVTYPFMQFSENFFSFLLFSSLLMIRENLVSTHNWKGHLMRWTDLV